VSARASLHRRLTRFAEPARARQTARVDASTEREEPAHRCGVVALLGRPNAGKSTLLNRLLGEKIAAVTHKPQTTRSQILGVVTRPHAQILLLDTPGLHDGGRPLDVAMREAALRAAQDCDVALLLVDPVRGFEPLHAKWLETLRGRRVPVLLVATQIDRAEAAAVPWPPPALGEACEALRVSAKTGEGIEALLDAVEARLPEGPPHFPADQLTDRPMRFLAAELAFFELGQELPYRLAVEVLEYDESDPALTRIRANLLVERASQKPIAIGRGGEKVREIGTRARAGIEELVGHQVHLELRVKVDPNWAKKPNRLKSLGYR
jgi:GTP-binding protein Era